MSIYELLAVIFISIGCGYAAGYQYAKKTVEPKMLYEQAHVFKEPIVVKDGDNLQMFFQIDDKYYCKEFEVDEDGNVTGLKYNLKVGD